MNDETFGEKVNSLYWRILNSFMRVLPQIESPRKHISLKEKLTWAGIILIIYFILGEITIYGMTQEAQDYFSFYKAVLASETGTLITLGIGPVVTAGIFMQLFQGAEFFHFDLTTHEGRAQFQGSQKLLAIFMCFFEALIYVAVGAFGHRSAGIEFFFMMQIAIGAVLIVLMDEVVTKWGFGSGISLFIAGGVAKDVIWKMLSFQESPATPGQAIGAIPSFIKSIMGGTPVLIRGDLPDIIQVLFTLVVFLMVVYFETLWIDVPLSLGKFRGTRGGYPLKFIYTSNIPIILAMSFLGTFQLFARALSGQFGLDFLGRFDAAGHAVGGIMYYISPPRGLFRLIVEPFRAVSYLLVIMVLCAFFSWLWVELTGMDSKTVAQRIQQAGVQVAGFQRDIRVIEDVLDRYIPPVTILGGISVGLLSAAADFTNALGTGTGILLTVSIVYRMYQDLLRDPELPDKARELLT